MKKNKKKLDQLYDDKYFLDRNLNDPKRLKSFLVEKKFIKKFISFNKTVCDVGCSTGEFLNYLDWKGKKFGIEVNKNAIKLAKKRNFIFQKNILNKKNYFDVVIFRGTIQHVDEPFLYLKKAFYSLKKGGYLFILATPNISSIYYRLFQNLPALDKNKNFYLPSFKNLKKICEIYGFKFIEVNYPYFQSGYDNYVRDFFYFSLKLLGLFRNKKISFPGNMMNIVFRK